MHIEAELDDIHAERLLRLQQRMNKPLTEIITGIVTRAIDEMAVSQETEGQKVLRILDDHKLLGCMEGDGNLSVDFKQHLWSAD
jgi:hypothetical protein